MPATMPATQPATQPATMPATQPATMPATQPATSRPTTTRILCDENVSEVLAKLLAHASRAEENVRNAERTAQTARAIAAQASRALAEGAANAVKVASGTALSVTATCVRRSTGSLKSPRKDPVRTTERRKAGTIKHRNTSAAVLAYRFMPWVSMKSICSSLGIGTKSLMRYVSDSCIQTNSLQYGLFYGPAGVYPFDRAVPHFNKLMRGKLLDTTEARNRAMQLATENLCTSALELVKQIAGAQAKVPAGMEAGEALGTHTAGKEGEEQVGEEQVGDARDAHTGGGQGAAETLPSTVAVP